MNILIVDDDEDIVSMLQFRLQKSGYQSSVAKSGAAALEQVKATKFDLLLIDLNIPEPNGGEVCKQLKGDPKFSAIPIILLTGSEKEQVGSLPMDALIIKPYEWEELLAKIQQLTKSTAH